jgi:hypothetical protein
MVHIAHSSVRSSSRRVRQRVNEQLQRLDDLPEITQSEVIALSQTWARRGEEWAGQLKNSTAGGPVDEHPPELIKYAPTKFFGALARIAAECCRSEYFPEAALAGLMTYMYKKGKKLSIDTLFSYRGLRCTSVAGKIMAKMVASPIYPRSEVSMLHKEQICNEQFAGKRKHSADMMALVLQLIIESSGNEPLYIILIDISKAFDSVWRDAIWVKLLSKGHEPKHVNWLKHLYMQLLTAVKGNDGNSDYVNLENGIGQGDPNSTDNYASFLADLPSELKRHKSIALFKILIPCLLFLDDVAIPCTTREQVSLKLATMNKYATDGALHTTLIVGRVECCDLMTATDRLNGPSAMRSFTPLLWTSTYLSSFPMILTQLNTSMIN